jgi:hypothetical protein
MTPAISQSSALRMASADSLPLESPLIQREGCIEEQGVYKEFKAIIDQGVPVGIAICFLLDTAPSLFRVPFSEC